MAERYFLILGLCVGFASCNKGVEPEPVYNYPMSAGDTWMYTGVDSQYNFRPSVPGTTFQNSSWNLTQRLQVVGLRTLPDSTRAWQFRSVEKVFETEYTNDHYYRTEGDTLKLVADSAGSVGLPKRGNQVSYLFKGKSSGSINELIAPYRLQLPVPASGQSGIELLENPQRVLLLPLRVGKQWSYNPEGTAPFPLWKKIVGTETVRSPAGTFSCYRIQWLWDLDNDGAWDTDIRQFDYVCSQGIIRRVLYLKDVRLSDPQHPEGSGLLDIIEMRTVTFLNIHPTNE